MSLLRWLTELNLFETNATDEQSIRIQRWSTKFYIIVLTSVIFILGVYASLHIISQRVEFKDLTLELYLQLENKYSLECPCSEVSIPYGQFVQLLPSYHQVCSSDFVTQRWIDYLFDPTTTPFYFTSDFRSSASQQFQLLASLCRLSAQAVNDGLRSFANTELIIDQLMSTTLLSAQMQSEIDAFKVNIPNVFYSTLDYVHNYLFGNNLLPATEAVIWFFLNKNNDGFWDIDIWPNGFLNTDTRYCDCNHFPTCYANAGFFGDVMLNYNGTTPYYAFLDVIDGWTIGCQSIDSLLFSTLKTFYNQTKLNSFLRYFRNSSANFTCLDSTRPTIFDPNNTTLDTIVQESFIENWTVNVIYSSYFALCAPKSCAHTVNQRFNIFYIISTVLGLYGGLSVALRFIIPIIVEFMFRRKQEVAARSANAVSWPKKLSRALLELNLFKSATEIEPSNIYQQRWSTKLYILFLALSLGILTLHTAVKIHMTQIDLMNPSLDTIYAFQQQMSSLSSFQCPCSRISSSLKDFVELTPIYHELCSSNYVSEYWIYMLTTAFLIDPSDFLESGPVFRLLQTLCDAANRTFEQALYLFYKTQFVTRNLLTLDHFESEMNSQATYFKLTTPSRLTRPLMLMRQTTRINQLISRLTTNWAFMVKNDTGQLKGYTIVQDSMVDRNGYSCSNILDQDCKIQSASIVYDQYGNSEAIVVPGFYAAFYFAESLLLSQLQCFYNESCINATVISHVVNLEHFVGLSRPSHYGINTTFAMLANNLFVESWNTTFDYEAYFAQCQPHSCSYISNQRSSLMSIITTVIGFFGGLSVLLRFVTPFIVTIIFSCCILQRTQEVPVVVIQRTSKKNAKN